MVCQNLPIWQWDVPMKVNARAISSFKTETKAFIKHLQSHFEWPVCCTPHLGTCSGLGIKTGGTIRCGEGEKLYNPWMEFILQFGISQRKLLGLLPESDVQKILDDLVLSAGGTRCQSKKFECIHNSLGIELF